MIEQDNDRGNAGIMDLLSQAVRQSLADREPLLLLSLLYAFLTLIVVWPVWEQHQYLWQHSQEFLTEMPPELADGLWGLGLAMVLTQVVWCGVMVTWARIIGQFPGKHSIGQAAAVTGGIGPLTRRTLTGFWRYLEYLGLSLLVALLLAMVVSRAFAIDPGAPAGALQALGVGLVVAVIAGPFLSFGGAFGINLYNVAQDRAGKLSAVWKSMAGFRIKVALSLILILVVPSIIVPQFVFVILTGLSLATEAEILGSLAFFLLSATVWGIVSCVWITFSGLLSARLAAQKAGENVDLDV